MKQHTYTSLIEWIGNEGEGTTSYRSYNRNHTIMVDGKSHSILGSSDPAFMGDTSRYNPEELFLSSISACHMLWYLHLCSANQIVVTDYIDNALGIMEEDELGSGRFTAVTLHPQVVVKHPDMISRANELHEEANKMCFIANSCNFNIGHQATTRAC